MRGGGEAQGVGQFMKMKEKKLVKSAQKKLPKGGGRSTVVPQPTLYPHGRHASWEYNISIIMIYINISCITMYMYEYKDIYIYIY